MYHAIGKAAFCSLVLFMGLLLNNFCPAKSWIVYICVVAVITIVICTYLYLPSAALNAFLLVIPFLSGLWLIYQSFVFVHLAHYFHFFVVSLKFGGLLSLFPGSCTVAPKVLLQIYASTAVLVNILLMYGLIELRNNFKLLLDSASDHHTGLLVILDVSFYLDILLSLLSIQPQFNKGLITMNSVIAYQLLLFSQLLPSSNSQFHTALRVISGLVTFVSVCYVIIDRQHSSFIIFHVTQCQKNPLYFTVPDADSDECAGPKRVLGWFTQLASRIMRMSPNQNAEETYELVSHTSDSDRVEHSNNLSGGSTGLGWSTLRNLYSSPNTSMESNEQQEAMDDLEEGGVELDPDCMLSEDNAETSLLRSSGGGGGGAVGSSSAVSNRMDRGILLESNAGGGSSGESSNVQGIVSGSGVGPTLVSGLSTKSKLSIASIPTLQDANYNSINSPSGSVSSNRNLDIENNYQESPSTAGCECCSCCGALCLMPAGNSRSSSYFTALNNVLVEKSLFFNLTMICLVCYCTALITDWSSPDGSPLNIFVHTSEGYNQSTAVYYIILCSVATLWLFYCLSLYGSYRLYYQYKRIRARLYRSRLVQHHPVRTSVIL